MSSARVVSSRYRKLLLCCHRLSNAADDLKYKPYGAKYQRATINPATSGIITYKLFLVRECPTRRNEGKTSWLKLALTRRDDVKLINPFAFIKIMCVRLTGYDRNNKSKTNIVENNHCVAMTEGYCLAAESWRDRANRGGPLR